MDGRVTLDERLTFRVDDTLLARAEGLAQEKGVNLSDVLRMALEAFCAEHPAQAAPHTPDECTLIVLSALPAELLAEVEARATRAGLTLREMVVATLTATWAESLQQARAKRPQADVHWPPRGERSTDADRAW